MPIQSHGAKASERVREASATITCDANNTTASEVVFTVTGSIILHGIWGVVTEATTITNHTAAHLRLNDQSATVDLTLNTGIALSGLAVGTTFTKTGLAAAALTLDNNAAGAISEPASAGQGILSPVIIVKKTGAVTTIDYRYSTTDMPHDCDIQFFALWEPLSADGNLA